MNPKVNLTGLSDHEQEQVLDMYYDWLDRMAEEQVLMELEKDYQ